MPCRMPEGVSVFWEGLIRKCSAWILSEYLCNLISESPSLLYCSVWVMVMSVSMFLSVTLTSSFCSPNSHLLSIQGLPHLSIVHYLWDTSMLNLSLFKSNITALFQQKINISSCVMVQSHVAGTVWVIIGSVNKRCLMFRVLGFI